MYITCLKICQHDYHYQNSEFCFYVSCKYERRLINKLCVKCSIHSHPEDQDYFSFKKIISPTKLSSYVFSKLCDIEFSILKQITDLCQIQEQIQYATSLIRNYLFIGEINDECQIFKSLQIIEIFKQQQQPNLDIAIKEFEQLVKPQPNKQKINMMSQTHNQQITKIHMCSEYLKYLTISPNGMYLLLGMMEYMYLYDISKKVNKKIHKITKQSLIAQFSFNSNKNIHATTERIVIFDIQKKEKKNQKRYIINACLKKPIIFIYQKSFYKRRDIYEIQSKLQLINLFILCIDVDCQVYFHQDLITYQNLSNLQKLTRQQEEDCRQIYDVIKLKNLYCQTNMRCYLYKRMGIYNILEYRL